MGWYDSWCSVIRRRVSRNLWLIAKYSGDSSRVMTTDEKLDLKATLNLTKTSFPQKANLGQREPERLQKWDQMDLYHQIGLARRGKPMFVLHDGPPYANADIHLGTAMNKILKDFVVKSHSMLGFDSPYVPGYDCHGLPIELFVDKELGAKKAQMDPVEFRRKCRDYASRALQRQTRDFKRLGILGEWENPYKTMSNSYEAETARIFARFVERGYVYKGARPVYWCIRDQTALADHEVEYHEHSSPSVYVKFPLPKDQVEELERRMATAEGSTQAPSTATLSDSGKPVFILIWTTTPWTLPANVGISVHPNYSYSAVEFGNEIYIVATDLVEAVAEKCALCEPRILASFQGKLLDGLMARHAWIDRPSLLMTGMHVTLGGEADAETELDAKDEEKKGTGKAGTGCVHTAPGHGHDDFVIGQEYREQLEPIYDQLRSEGKMPKSGEGSDVYCPVTNNGRFVENIAPFGGMQVFEANRPIVEFLRETGALVVSEEYGHRYPHCWRCKNPVIFRATSQWFISMDRSAGDRTDVSGRPLREGALAETQSVRWIPEWGEKRMRNMLARRPDWCVSRQRLWGVPIPAFYCSECNATVIDPGVIEHVASIFERESADVWYSRDAEGLLPQGFTCSACGGTQFAKEKDILDVWFDSGSSSVAVLEKERNLPWPADVYLEGGDQYRGWFNSSLMVGLAVHDRAPYKTVITHGWLLDGEGKAMHKSAGNSIPPDKVMQSSGAEILRLWASSSNYNEDMRASDEILRRQVDTYRKLRNTARFALGNIYDFDPDVDTVPDSDLLEVDRWALAATGEVVAKAVGAYRNFDYASVYHTLYNYATVTLSSVYFDVLKDRLYTFAPKSIGRRSAQTVLTRIVEAFALLLAPILVFTADEIWEHLPGKRQPSVHLATFPEPKHWPTDQALLERWAEIINIRSVIQKALEEKRTAKVIGGSVEARLVIYAGGAAYDLLESYRDQLPAIFIVSQVEIERTDDDSLRVEVDHARGKKCERCWNWSVTVGDDAQYPSLDARCIKQIEEGWGGGQR
jgi:isoleucyl-tRNA synthetase